MSNIVADLVYDRAPYSDDRFNVLLALADWANDDGRSCYFSLVKLARKSRVSYRNTVYSIQKLEAERIRGEPILSVTRYNKKGVANEYLINVPLLESLPYYWPDDLQIGVPSSHTNSQQTVVGKSPSNGTNGGKNGAQPAVQRNGAAVNHGRGATVENFREKLFSYLPPAAVVEFAGASPIPLGTRYVCDETDPGGWSQVEVMEAYKELVPHPPSSEDRKELQKLKEFPFSTQLTIYLMQRTKAKAGSPPGSMKYFRVALERLWADCSIAIAKAREETYSMTCEQAFWKLNEAVLKEIAFWQRGLSRS